MPVPVSRNTTTYILKEITYSAKYIHYLVFYFVLTEILALANISDDAVSLYLFKDPSKRKFSIPLLASNSKSRIKLVRPSMSPPFFKSLKEITYSAKYIFMKEMQIILKWQKK